MKLLISGRQTGKTTKLIEMLRSNPSARLIGFSKNRAEQLKKQYPDVADKIHPPHNLHFFSRGRFHSDIKWLVDDVEILLHHLLGVDVQLATGVVQVEKLEISKDLQQWIDKASQELGPSEYKRRFYGDWSPEESK